jgi:hypothetical protein
MMPGGSNACFHVPVTFPITHDLGAGTLQEPRMIGISTFGSFYHKTDEDHD